jgi:hypothetical protein
MSELGQAKTYRSGLDRPGSPLIADLSCRRGVRPKCAKSTHPGMPAMAGHIGSEVADPDYSGRPEARIASIRGVASTGTQPMAEH